MFQSLIALFALSAQTRAVTSATDNSSVSTKLNLYNALSEYVLPNFNNTMSSLRVDGNTGSRVSTTAGDVNTMAVDNAGGSADSDSIPITTVTFERTRNAGNVAGENVYEKTANITMNAGNPASGSVHGYTASNTLDADAVASVMNGTVSADTVASVMNGTVSADTVASVMNGTVSADTAASVMNGTVSADTAASIMDGTVSADTAQRASPHQGRLNAMLCSIGAVSNGCTSVSCHSERVLSLSSLSPFLTGRTFYSPNILRTVGRTMIRFLIELLVCRTEFGQFDELRFNEMQAVARTYVRKETKKTTLSF